MKKRPKRDQNALFSPRKRDLSDQVYCINIGQIISQILVVLIPNQSHIVDSTPKTNLQDLKIS